MNNLPPGITSADIDAQFGDNEEVETQEDIELQDKLDLERADDLADYQRYSNFYNR